MSIDGPAHLPETESLYTQIVAKTERQHRLLSAHWELTYRCNEKCTHCYLDVFSPNATVPGELTTEECFRIIDEMADLGVLHLTLSGGEILVRRDIFEIAEYARAKGFLLRLFTNGILIKPLLADRIANLHPYAVEISVYSTQPAAHDEITRVPRSHELSLRALRLLHERGVRTIMKTPLMRENVQEIDALKTLAQDLGAQFRYDITITPKDTGGLEPLEHRLTYDDLVWLFRKEIDPALWVNRITKLDQGTCGITLNGISIDPYGNVNACVQTRAKAGNIRDRTLRDIWENSPVWQEYKLTLGDLPICRTCELRNLCVRCHGLAQFEDGDLRAPASVNCREALARRQVLVERGDLPTDYPIPQHLKAFAATAHPPITVTESGGDLIPLTSLEALRRVPANVNWE